MAQYDITSPDGQKFRVTAPDDATQEQVMAYAQKNFKLAATPKERSWSDVPGDAVSNLWPSAKNLVSGLANAVLHPIDTVGSVLDIGAGALRNAMPESIRNAVDSVDTPENQQAGVRASDTASAVGQFYKDRYGKNLKDTLATDPVGVAADAATLLSGGAGLARQAAKVPILAAKAPAVASALDSAATAVNPLRPVVDVASYALQRGRPYVQQNPGNLLKDAIGANPDEVRSIIAAANSAPQSIIKGSDLTLAQALAHQGLNNPNVNLLERIAAGGPGGNTLLQRYANQAEARTALLGENGAETYQGAAADVAENTGNKVGSILRTQANDDKLAARHAWQGNPEIPGDGGVYGQALLDNVRLKLPLDQMESAMSPLGRGSVIKGNDARNVLETAQNIGTMEIPAVDALKAGPALKSQSLEQAVRAEGGIRGGSGELRDLGIKQSGTTGLVNNKSGQSADLLAQKMFERGYIPDADPATLFDALRNGGGRKLFANDQVQNNSLQMLHESAMGDAPAAERIPVSVPFDEYQRLRRDSGALAAKVGERAGGETEAGVLKQFQGLLADTADQAVEAGLNGGGLLGENMTPEFLAKYNAARNLTKQNAELYKSGNNISQILRKPEGQNYTLSGNEVTSKLWHGGQGLVGDVQNLKNTLNSNNYNPALDALRKHVMTEAASKTKASGELGAALPKYVETRLPGMQELMTPDQLGALTGVAKDIRNAETAANVSGLRGSDTQAKITRALDAGLLDSPLAKTLGKVTSVKGIGGETVRTKLAQMVIENKGKTVADLLANPRAAAAALQDADFVQQIDAKTFRKLSATAKLAPILADRVTESAHQ
jgi:hypothetical protein